MGLFSKTKVKPEPIPMEERPVQYMRFPVCRHPADEMECGCYSWDVEVGSSYGIDNKADRVLLPSRRGSTKRTLMLLPDDQEAPEWVPFFSLANEHIGHAAIPKSQRYWASSDDTRLVYQVWLIVTRTDEEDDDEPMYEAKLRFSAKGQLLFFDEGDPAAFAP